MRYLGKTTYIGEVEILTATKFSYHFELKLTLQVEQATWSIDVSFRLQSGLQAKNTQRYEMHGITKIMTLSVHPQGGMLKSILGQIARKLYGFSDDFMETITLTNEYINVVRLFH